VSKPTKVPGFDCAVVAVEHVTTPRTVAFVAHCRKLQGDRVLPRWADLRLHELDPEMIPYVAVADVAAEPRSFTYRFWGTGHTRLKGVDLTRQQVSEIPATALAEIGHRQYEMVLEQRKPLVFVHKLSHYEQWKPYIQVTARVPFSENGSTVDKIVSYSNFDEDREKWTKVYDEVVVGNA